jgi:hypothetical protein
MTARFLALSHALVQKPRQNDSVKRLLRIMMVKKSFVETAASSSYFGGVLRMFGPESHL